LGPQFHRNGSNENTATVKVSIDINSSQVKSSLGMKKMMKKMGNVRALTNRNNYKSFNMGNNIDPLREVSPQRSEGKY